jgi:glutamate-1-semialdehyde 2,1-aminomutase
MTSRLAPGGFAQLYGLEPDLKSYGKYLGGGITFGAFGGRKDILDIYDPRKPNALMHGGTFNNNTLVVYAGHAGLTQVYTPDICKKFNEMGDQFREKLLKVTKGTKMCFTGMGSLLASHFTESGAQSIERKCDEPEIEELKDIFWYEMLEEGFWPVRRGNICLILGTPQEELDRFVDCVEAFLQRHAALVKV